MVDDIEALQHLEESLWQRATRFNRTDMERIFAPDLMEFGCSGRQYDREALLDFTDTEINAVLPLRDFAVRFFGNNVALVTYISEMTYGDRIQRCRRSSLWSRVADEWRLHFHQGTPVSQGQLDDA